MIKGYLWKRCWYKTIREMPVITEKNIDEQTSSVAEASWNKATFKVENALGSGEMNHKPLDFANTFETKKKIAYVRTILMHVSQRHLWWWLSECLLGYLLSYLHSLVPGRACHNLLFTAIGELVYSWKKKKADVLGVPVWKATTKWTAHQVSLVASQVFYGSLWSQPL